jgi:hypothetical protein
LSLISKFSQDKLNQNKLSKDNLSQGNLVPDNGINLGLGLLVFITRIPLANRYLYEWDSVQHALGLENFDLSHHQPHPLGCIIYLALLKLSI